MKNLCETCIIEIKNLRYSKPSNNPWEFKVDRTSPVGNPFYMASETKRDEVCDKYQRYFEKQISNNGALFSAFGQKKKPVIFSLFSLCFHLILLVCIPSFIYTL